ncbi:hypothetical protein BY458DRAFT_532766 [Sporodiniella umbellata]|nr:hypothetical protein BY458DRAFT_532766 [Sporodiniella umbellata]
MRDLTGLLHDNTQDQYNPLQIALDPQHVAVCLDRAGYLFERKQGRVYPSWTKRYFCIANGELISISRSMKEDNTQRWNLRVCSVKLTDGYDRRFCFEVISPTKVLVLQAENEQAMNEWIASIRAASQMALNSHESPTYAQPSPYQKKTPPESTHAAHSTEKQDEEKNREALEQIRLMAGNEICADCQAMYPEWACTNLGVIVMLQLGNRVGNSIYEQKVPPHLETFKINPESKRKERNLWIIEKYIKKSFVKPAEVTKDVLDQQLWDAVADNDLASALRALAQGALIDSQPKGKGLQTPLQKAVDNNNETTVEFLLQSQSNVNQQDERGWTALHYAAANNNVRLVLTLLKRHGQPDILNHSEKVKQERSGGR